MYTLFLYGFNLSIIIISRYSYACSNKYATSSFMIISCNRAMGAMWLMSLTIMWGVLVHASGTKREPTHHSTTMVRTKNSKQTQIAEMCLKNKDSENETREVQLR